MFIRRKRYKDSTYILVVDKSLGNYGTFSIGVAKNDADIERLEKEAHKFMDKRHGAIGSLFPEFDDKEEY